MSNNSTKAQPYVKPVYYDTMVPYCKIEHTGIEYNTCCNYSHISRYKGLRQVAHNPKDSDRFVALETPNPFISNVKKTEYDYYTVTQDKEHRLDLISQEIYGSPQYSWVISYLNNIEDGFSVFAGQRLKYVKSISSLFANGEILAAIPALQLNLGSE